MGKSKSKKKKWVKNLESEYTESEIPIPNLPEKILLMRVNFKTFTKINIHCYFCIFFIQLEFSR